MKILSINKIVIALAVSGLSISALANHPVNANIEVDRDSLNFVRLHQVKLRHNDDGNYILTGKVRRLNKLPVASGHFDLVASDSDGTLYEDAEYYWPRIVNRKYKYPSTFTFTIPENIVDSETIKLSFHRNKLANKPKPTH